MALRVVGAGLPRTGTKSLQTALERLLGGRCYHMTEVYEHLDHVPIWRRALRGAPPDWRRFLADYVAAVDWPVAAFWKEISQAFPDAIPVLSIRDDRQEWWDSVDQTILGVARRDPDPAWGDWQELFHDLLRDRWGLSAAEGWGNAAAAIAAYDHHNEEVRATAPADRLVVWRPADGWAPICRALGVAIPDEPFPHVNTRAEWAAGSDAAGA